MHQCLKRVALTAILAALPTVSFAAENWTPIPLTGKSSHPTPPDIAAYPLEITFTCYGSQEQLETAMAQAISVTTKALTPFRGEGELAQVAVGDQTVKQVPYKTETYDLEVPVINNKGEVEKEDGKDKTEIKPFRRPLEGCNNSWEGTLRIGLLTHSTSPKENTLGKAEQAATSALKEAGLLAPKAEEHTRHKNRAISKNLGIGYWLTAKGVRKIEDEITRPASWKDHWAKFEFLKESEKGTFLEAYVVSVSESGHLVLPVIKRDVPNEGVARSLAFSPPAPAAAPTPVGGQAPSMSAVKVGLGTINVSSHINVGWNVRQKTQRNK